MVNIQVNSQTKAHFFGYEGRCAMPSNFDADYCYSLGYNAFALISAGLTGYLSSVKNLTKPANQWFAGGVPFNNDDEYGKTSWQDETGYSKALVELDGPVFKEFEANREKWAKTDCYVFRVLFNTLDLAKFVISLRLHFN